MWPETKIEKGSKEEDVKQIVTPISMLSVNKDRAQIWRLEPARYSRWKRLVRVRAWLQRFLSNCRSKVASRKSGQLTADEIEHIEEDILREAQQRAFHTEYQALVNGTALPNSSKIMNLSPPIDEDGLLRCGGRLSNAEHLSYNTKHPIILSRKFWVTKLIVKDYHEQRNMLVASIRLWQT
ncbi:hypothetical protein HOLleu_11565 [Holothuria leucospilota]|uniref:Uncharacterized protein n=1 Tax=Holothuria leucospilota TaxID=206669 RepID=A0A9Q1CGQ7_HOLLE|nr:hypothetical protein HOLleu_11565 [Holothuria leucospilota]